MKRSVAFLAAVCVSIGILSATSATAQLAPPPADASGDSVQSDTPAAPAAQPQDTPAAAAAPDTTGQSARVRRMRVQDEGISYIISLGIGPAINYQPDRLANEFSPIFGAMMGFGVRLHGVTAGVHFGYNFFLADGTTPNDLNILTVMGELKYGPVFSKARPYLVVCGGYYRQWIVDLDYTENVLGYGGGAGLDMTIGSSRAIFFDARYIMGQTREFEETKANTEIIPMRLGIRWEIR
jgi:hypothetical protein